MKITNVELDFFFFRILSHFYVGSMFLIRRLHLARYFASASDNIILSPTSRYWCYLTTSSSVFISFFSRHSLAYIRPIFFFSSQYMPVPLQPTFLHFLGYFSHLRCPSNSVIPNSVSLDDSTHSQPFRTFNTCD